LKDLTILVDQLRNNQPVDWNSWRTRGINNALRLFIQLGRISDTEEPLDQYELLIEQIKWARKNIQMLVSKFIEKTTGMRMFLLIHSRFPISAKKDGDWFTKMMIDYLNPTEEEIGRITKVPSVPDDILEKLKMFDPEPIGFLIEPIRIEYQLYGARDPINVIDEDFEKEKGVEGFVYTTVSSYSQPILTYTPDQNNQFDDNDIPF